MIKNKILLLLLLCAIVALFCGFDGKKKASVRKEIFGKMSDGTNVEIYTLTNKNNVEVRIPRYGGAVVLLNVPDKNGNFDDGVLGFDDL